MKHEFYDATRTGKDGKEIVFADSVQNKAFDFLYRLAVGLIPGAEGPSAVSPVFAMVRPSIISMGEGGLNFTVVRDSDVAYAMFDLKGKRVLSGRASKGETVRLSSVNNGVYFLHVQGESPRRVVIRK